MCLHRSTKIFYILFRLFRWPIDKLCHSRLHTINQGCQIFWARRIPYTKLANLFAYRYGIETNTIESDRYGIETSNWIRKYSWLNKTLNQNKKPWNHTFFRRYSHCDAESFEGALKWFSARAVNISRSIVSLSFVLHIFLYFSKSFTNTCSAALLSSLDLIKQWATCASIWFHGIRPPHIRHTSFIVSSTDEPRSSVGGEEVTVCFSWVLVRQEEKKREERAGQSIINPTTNVHYFSKWHHSRL